MIDLCKSVFEQSLIFPKLELFSSEGFYGYWDAKTTSCGQPFCKFYLVCKFSSFIVILKWESVLISLKMPAKRKVSSGGDGGGERRPGWIQNLLPEGLQGAPKPKSVFSPSARPCTTKMILYLVHLSLLRYRHLLETGRRTFHDLTVCLPPL